jgi:sugar phosphate isomerase/epimerase
MGYEIPGGIGVKWSSIMPKEPEVLADDLRVRGLRMLGGFVGLELRNPAKREEEVKKGVEIGVETEAETCRLLDATDAALVGWCLDCGHLTYGGGDTLRMLQKYGDRVGYVHIKDVDGELLRRSREEGWSFHEALKCFIFPQLGEGMVNIPAVVRALKDHRYDGWLVVEQDTTPVNPTTIAKENRLYLEALLESETQSLETG